MKCNSILGITFINTYACYLAEQQLLDTAINGENTIKIFELIGNEDADDKARMAAATFLKTSLSKIYNVSFRNFASGIEKTNLDLAYFI